MNGSEEDYLKLLIMLIKKTSNGTLDIIKQDNRVIQINKKEVLLVQES